MFATLDVVLDKEPEENSLICSISDEAKQGECTGRLATEALPSIPFDPRSFPTVAFHSFLAIPHKFHMPINMVYFGLKRLQQLVLRGLCT